MPPRSTQMFDVLKLLQPYDVFPHRKRRIGAAGGGGYVMFDDFDECAAVYTFGSAWSVDFDDAFANMGKAVHMFDSESDTLPREHPNFHFSRLGLAGAADPANNLFSLDGLVHEMGHDGRTDLVLKLDVDGAEWDVLSRVEPATLACFQQVVIEAHWLHRLIEPEFCMAVEASLRRMNDQFILGHVHANNNRPVAFIDGFAVADVMELSYIRADRAERRASTRVYPQDLDASNDPSRPDHLLWFFPFLPLHARAEVRMFDASLRSGNKSVIEAHARDLSDQIVAHESQIAALQRARDALWP